MKRTIYLVRHCQAAGQPPEAELTDKGRAQAIELIDFFKDRSVEHIISSPFLRAIQTGDPLANSLGMNIEIDGRLAERVLSLADLPDWMKRLEASFEDLELKLPGGESGSQATERGMAVLENAPNQTILITHGNMMGLLLKRIIGNYGFEEWKQLSNPDVYEVAIEGVNYSARRLWK
ncbi:histidine phosphatase family protein [Planococcus sp. YIM B11945]|uniref:histidine phosphatase family protein n=1 Tax=Planococcus sp. YIM B11945 TaxID=3435410 RepID=UPI003D7DFD4A